jgi:subtilisin family serine protease
MRSVPWGSRALIASVTLLLVATSTIVAADERVEPEPGGDARTFPDEQFPDAQVDEVPSDPAEDDDLEDDSPAEDGSSGAGPIVTLLDEGGPRRVSPALLSDARVREGRLPVIVDLAPRREFEGPASSPSRKEAIRRRQLEVIARLPAQAAGGNLRQPENLEDRALKLFDYTASFAIHATVDELASLLSDPGVSAVYRDVPSRPTAFNSVRLIGADADGLFDGYSGEGLAVAILDTGVLSSSAAFRADAVVAEACFSTSTAISISLCPDGRDPGGQDVQYGSGAGVDCEPFQVGPTGFNLEFIGAVGCSHGTHVASTAAGMTQAEHLAGGVTYRPRSVATGASIVAIQVFSQFDEFCVADNSFYLPCVLTWDSDQIRGLEFVLSLALGDAPAPYGDFAIPIASANMSLGGGMYGSACDADYSAAYRGVVTALRGSSVAVVAASGNDGYRTAIGALPV